MLDNSIVVVMVNYIMQVKLAKLFSLSIAEKKEL